MARSSERLAAPAFTRLSVEAYLQAAAEQRVRIELAIAEAERRREAAEDALALLEGLDGPGANGAMCRNRTDGAGGAAGPGVEGQDA